jgi:hypothetical protein
VTFRLRAPNAQAVTVALEGAFDRPLSLQKDASGLWCVKTTLLDPVFFFY